MNNLPPDNVVSLFSSVKTQAVPAEIQEKRQIFTQFLEAGVVSVGFAPREPLCAVPPSFRENEELILNFAYAYQVKDFAFDDVGIQASLTFPEGFFYCFVPWNTVFSMHSDTLRQSAFWNIERVSEPVVEKPKPRLTLIRDD